MINEERTELRKNLWKEISPTGKKEMKIILINKPISNYSSHINHSKIGTSILKWKYSSKVLVLILG